MRKFIILLLLLTLAAAAYGGYCLYQTFQPAELEYSTVELPDALPFAAPPAEMAVSVISTGQMYSRQAFTFRGGKFGVEYISAMDALLVQHPKGDFLIDTGFGANIHDHVQTTPFLMRSLADYEFTENAANQLEIHEYSTDNLAGIILTHAHWDHVSGIPDFPEVPIWINQDELDFIREAHEETVLINSFENVEYLIYAFDDGPYMGYPESLDVYRDGSLVLVPIGGHTPGSVGVFLNLPSGKRLMMVGDIVWAREGIELPAERPLLARDMVDHDEAAVREAIGHLHQLHKRFPDLEMLPAHDRRAFETLSQYPSRTH